MDKIVCSWCNGSFEGGGTLGCGKRVGIASFSSLKEFGNLSFKVFVCLDSPGILLEIICCFSKSSGLIEGDCSDFGTGESSGFLFRDELHLIDSMLAIDEALELANMNLDELFTTP